MTREQELTLHNFEALVRQLMMAYEEEKRSNAALRSELAKAKEQIESAQSDMLRLKHDYEVLRTARIIEVSGDDVKDARARIAKLIREVDKCIALLDV